MEIKIFVLSFAILTSFFSYADGEVAEIIEYSALCTGRGFDLKPMNIEWSGSFERKKLMDNLDAGPTNFKITRVEDGKVFLDTKGSSQKFFRQTEAGVSFFGIYNNATMTNTNQTVYFAMVYGQITSIYWYMSAIKSGRDLYKSLDGTTFRMQAFAEEDPSSTLSLEFNCNFSVK